MALKDKNKQCYLTWNCAIQAYNVGITAYKKGERTISAKEYMVAVGKNLNKREEFQHLFLREGKSIAQLTHPNIVNIYDMGIADFDLDGYLDVAVVESGDNDPLGFTQGSVQIIRSPGK